MPTLRGPRCPACRKPVLLVEGEDRRPFALEPEPVQGGEFVLRRDVVPDGDGTREVGPRIATRPRTGFDWTAKPHYSAHACAKRRSA